MNIIQQLDELSKQLLAIKEAKSEISVDLKNKTQDFDELKSKFFNLLKKSGKDTWIYNNQVLRHNEKERTPAVTSSDMKHLVFECIQQHFGMELAWSMFTFSTTKFDAFRKDNLEFFEKNNIKGIQNPVLVKTFSVKKI